MSSPRAGPGRSSGLVSSALRASVYWSQPAALQVSTYRSRWHSWHLQGPSVGSDEHTHFFSTLVMCYTSWECSEAGVC